MTVPDTAAAHHTSSPAVRSASASSTFGNCRPIRMNRSDSSRKTRTSQNPYAFSRVLAEKSCDCLTPR
jgi:hypothetical protein